MHRLSKINFGTLAKWRWLTSNQIILIQGVIFTLFRIIGAVRTI
jgi:hypothetical protein